MEESYIQLFDRNEKSIRFLMVLSIILITIGLIGVIFNYISLESPLLVLNEWNSWLLVMVGITMFFMLNSSLKFKRFYFSWNSDEINYHFPNNKQPELIRIDKIQSIQINHSEVKILLKNNETKNINLNFVFIPKRKYIKEYFESLRVNIA